MQRGNEARHKFEEKLLKTTIIINPGSGTPKFIARLKYLINKRFGRNNDKVSIVKSQHPGHVLELAKRSAQQGEDLVVAAGGDGTVNEVAQGIYNTKTALGVIPTGSGNGFARNMKLPLQLEKAIDQIYNPDYRTIDIGQVGKNIFLVSCGLGWEAAIADLFDNSRIRGFFPYAAFTISTFMRYHPQETRIIAEPGGWSYKGHPMLFTIANMREYGVGATIAPDADYNDGLLDICIVPRHTFLNTIKYTPELFRKRIDVVPGYIGQLAREIIVSRPVAGNIHVDGSPIPAGNEITLKVLPKALNVVVNKDVNNETS